MPITAAEAGCSYTPPKSNVNLRLNKSFVKAKARKDIRDKSKTSLARKQKVNKPQKVRKAQVIAAAAMAEKASTSSTESDSSRGVQLSEICFIKSNEGKTVIAKYKSKDQQADDKMVVSWNSNGGSAQIFTQKGRVNSAPSLPSYLATQPEPGCSKQGLFRVHHFGRNATFYKAKKKNSLRRLASATESISKVEKKKIKKLKK